MPRERFEQLVEEAVRNIPAKFSRLIRNLTVMVEDFPSPEVYRKTGTPRDSLIFGLYHGVPFGKRGPGYGNVPPDVISIYRRPIESVCRNESEIRAKIEEVLVHEIGHYFGFDDPQLYQVERERREKGRSSPKE
jgi:predicted Zn-dependent protease with MMP-like domain